MPFNGKLLTLIINYFSFLWTRGKKKLRVRPALRGQAASRQRKKRVMCRQRLEEEALEVQEAVVTR